MSPTPVLPKKSPSPLVNRASQTQSAANQYPFLLKAAITALVNNQAGVEEKRVMVAIFQIDYESAKMPWYVLANFLVPSYLNEKMGPQGQGWKKVYEIKIEKLINRNDPKSVEGIPMRVMTAEQLQIYVTRRELPVHIELFHDIAYARQMVALYEEDPKGYQLQLANYLAGKKRQYPELDNIRKNIAETSAAHLEDEFDQIEKNSETAKPIKTKPGAVTTELTPAEQEALEATPAGGAAAQPTQEANPFDNV